MPPRPLPDLGLRPLTARSIVLSALLGTHPPRLRVRALVALAEPFGIAEGTIRTALSRMAAAGEVEADDGSYGLGGRLARRQADQDVALHAPVEPWDGTWWIAVVDAPARPLAERRRFRASMVEHRMGELRPDTWLRPANIAGPPPTEGVLVVRGGVADRSDVDLARRLWDLDALATTARRLADLARDACSWLEDGAPEILRDTFLVSVAAVRHLRAEPQLPRAIVGDRWPADELRQTYHRLQQGHSDLLRTVVARSAPEHR